MGSSLKFEEELTVSAYIRTIYIKMGVSNRVTAVLRALALVRSLASGSEVTAFQVKTTRIPGGR